MHIRPARPDEAEVLAALAVRSRAYWPHPPALLARLARDAGLTPEVVAANDVQVAEHRGEIRGFYTILHRGASAVLDDLWLEPAEIGRGSGRLLFEHAAAAAAAAGATSMVWDAEPHSTGFYLRMGAVTVGWTDPPHGRRQPVMRRSLVDLPAPPEGVAARRVGRTALPGSAEGMLAGC